MMSTLPLRALARLVGLLSWRGAQKVGAALGLLRAFAPSLFGGPLS